LISLVKRNSEVGKLETIMCDSVKQMVLLSFLLLSLVITDLVVSI